MPLLLCDEIEPMMNSFKSWDILCVWKGGGGLGFQKVHQFNVALLAKQGWRLITCPDSLLSRVYEARYFPTSSFLEASIGNNPSYAWRKGARIRIENSSSTKI